MRRNLIFILLPLLIASLTLCGCAGFRGSPPRATNPKAELEVLADDLKPEIIKKYDESPSKALRNKIVIARIRATNIRFDEFQEMLYQEGVGYGIATDWAVLALDAAGTLVGGAGTKAALAATSGGLTGAKAAYDKNVYFKKTMPAILAQMIARRKAVSVRIYSGLTKNIEDYPLIQALVDLEDYYNAGTIPGAIMEIIETSGETGKTADKDLKALTFVRTKEFVEPERQERVNKILDKIDKLDNEKAIKLVKSPPVKLDDRLIRIADDADHENKRLTDGSAARNVLKAIASHCERNDANLNVWEEALK